MQTTCMWSQTVSTTYGLPGSDIFLVITDFQRNVFDMIFVFCLYNSRPETFISTHEEWIKMGPQAFTLSACNLCLILTKLEFGWVPSSGNKVVKYCQTEHFHNFVTTVKIGETLQF
jgi:hypothetical protein